MKDVQEFPNRIGAGTVKLPCFKRTFLPSEVRSANDLARSAFNANSPASHCSLKRRGPYASR